jgi:hypothetical protein
VVNKQGRIKYGFGMNLEQELTHTLRAYGRFGWNNGKTESFATSGGRAVESRRPVAFNQVSARLHPRAPDPA